VLARRAAGLFSSMEELVARAPSRKELTLLTSVGALNSLDGVSHRRDALWQAERATSCSSEDIDKSSWRYAGEAAPVGNGYGLHVCFPPWQFVWRARILLLRPEQADV
jgi:hypothetical protein